MIEPNPNQFELLRKNRPNNLLFNNLISCETKPLTFRYFLNQHAAVSGVENTLSEHHFDTYFDSNNEFNKSLKQDKIIIVPITLTDVIKKSKLMYIDLLSLDVEGHEYEVLKSWDFSVPIRIILIEMLGVQPDKDELCREILLKNNYKYITKYKHNEIYELIK